MASTKWQHPFTQLLDDDFKLWCAGDDAPSVSEIATLEKRLGSKLPGQYRKYLGCYGGVMLEVLENVWPRPKLYQVGPYWTGQYAYLVFGIGKDIPEWLDIETVTKELHRDFPESAPLVPFFRQISTSKFYLCFDSEGRICDWSSEDPSERRFLEDGFDDVILRETQELKENKEKIKNVGLSGLGVVFSDKP
jgi:hypothetical protein